MSHTTFNCENAFELSEWWKQVLHYVDLKGDPNEPTDEECRIVDPTGGHRLFFIEAARQEPPGRIHLDLAPTDRSRDDEVERLRALGARDVADCRNADGTGWAVLANPSGNRFCTCAATRRVGRHRHEVDPERCPRGSGRARWRVPVLCATVASLGLW